MAATTAEMNDFAKEYFAACLARDTEYIIAHSAEDEVAGFSGFHSGRTLDHSVADSVRTIGPLPPASCKDSAPTGWMIGDVAWLTDFPIAVLPNGDELPEKIRVSFVMRRVEGEWKMAHWHLSEPFPRDLHAK